MEKSLAECREATTLSMKNLQLSVDCTLILSILSFLLFVFQLSKIFSFIPTHSKYQNKIQANNIIPSEIHKWDLGKVKYTQTLTLPHRDREVKEGCNTRTSQGVTHPSTALA